jgi:hypothetical protein
MSAGALGADPRLEEWVRREYRLPERDPDTPWTPPKAVPGANLPGQHDAGQPGAAQDATAGPSSDAAGSGTAQTDVAARQADLDWGLFGAQPGGEQMDLFDQPAEQDPGTSGVDVAKFSF